jgi:cytochrome oxidase Cu insertion factor (SCO1/SenC/PrrC family)
VSSRLKLLLIAGVCAAPLVFGTLAYVMRWGQGGTANYGELIVPEPIAGAPLEAVRGKWVLVSFDRAACDEYCERKLYFMRQTRKAQGKDMERVERLWVLTDEGAPRPALLAAIEGTRVVPRADGTLERRFPGNVADHIYVVDPLGNLMMRFPRDPDPSKILKDLQRLLKYSRIG